MKRVTVPWVSIRKSEIHCNCQIDLTPTKDVFKEGVGPLYFEVLKCELGFFRQCELLGALLELSQGYGLDHIQEFVLAACG